MKASKILLLIDDGLNPDWYDYCVRIKVWTRNSLAEPLSLSNMLSTGIMDGEFLIDYFESRYGNSDLLIEIINRNISQARRQGDWAVLLKYSLSNQITKKNEWIEIYIYLP